MEQPKDKKEEVIDTELEKAKKSMGGHIDGDIPPKKPEEEKPPLEEKPPIVKKDITPGDKKPDEELNPDGTPKVHNRGERFIPMKKFHDTERAHEIEVSTLQKKIADLEIIAKSGDGVKKDEDIEQFMATTGFSREVVEGLLSLAEKRLMKPELVEAIKKAENIVKEAEIDTAFTTEFTSAGEPALKTYFPNITADQLEKAKEFLDKVSHTKEFHDKSLKYIVFENQDALKELFGDSTEVTPPNKKTIEGKNPGGGKPVALTAKDFTGKTDFAELNDMEPAFRSQLIKEFDDKTYRSFTQWAGRQDSGLEVMRNGGRIMLK